MLFTDAEEWDCRRSSLLICTGKSEKSLLNNAVDDDAVDDDDSDEEEKWWKGKVDIWYNWWRNEDCDTDNGIGWVGELEDDDFMRESFWFIVRWSDKPNNIDSSQCAVDFNCMFSTSCIYAEWRIEWWLLFDTGEDDVVCSDEDECDDNVTGFIPVVEVCLLNREWSRLLKDAERYIPSTILHIKSIEKFRLVLYANV